MNTKQYIFAGVMLTGFCIVFIPYLYVTLFTQHAISNSTLKRNGYFLRVSIDWDKRGEIDGLFPIWKIEGQLFSSSFSPESLGLKQISTWSDYRVINNEQYKGFMIGGEEELGEQRKDARFYSRLLNPNELEVFLELEIPATLFIDNFNGNIVGTDALQYNNPNEISVGKYHLRVCKETMRKNETGSDTLPDQ